VESRIGDDDDSGAPAIADDESAGEIDAEDSAALGVRSATQRRLFAIYSWTASDYIGVSRSTAGCVSGEKWYFRKLEMAFVLN